MIVDPASLSRRSRLWRALTAAGAVFEEVRGMAAPLHFGDPDGEAAQATSLGLCDISALARAGAKGWTAVAWAATIDGVAVPETNNTALLQADGAWLARLADSEVLIVGALDGGDAGLASPPEGAYPVPREDTNAALMVTGSRAPELFSRLCAVDTRPHRFANGAVAQTHLAGLNAIIIRTDLGPTLAFRCLFDNTAALYLWRILTDAMAELDGAPVGLAALRALEEG